LESSKLVSLSKSLQHLSPATSYDRWRQQLDWMLGRLDRAEANHLDQIEALLEGLSGRLAAVDPQATPARGYAIVSREDKKLVQRVGDVQTGDSLVVRVQDGEFGAEVD